MKSSGPLPVHVPADPEYAFARLVRRDREEVRRDIRRQKPLDPERAPEQFNLPDRLAGHHVRASQPHILQPLGRLGKRAFRQPGAFVVGRAHVHVPAAAEQRGNLRQAADRAGAARDVDAMPLARQTADDRRRRPCRNLKSGFQADKRLDAEAVFHAFKLSDIRDMKRDAKILLGSEHSGDDVKLDLGAAGRIAAVGLGDGARAERDDTDGYRRLSVAQREPLTTSGNEIHE